MTKRLKPTRKASVLPAACAILAVCASCSNMEVTDGPGEVESLNFGISISDEWNIGATRAGALETDGSQTACEGDLRLTTYAEQLPVATRSIPITTADLFREKFGSDGFGITAIYHDGAGNISTYMDRVQCTASGTENIWAPDRTYYWPEGGSLSFNAWAPFKANGDETYGPVADDNQHLTLTHTVPNFARDQRDLLIATADIDCAQGKRDKLDGNSVTLEFSHALTAVKIQFAGNPERRINRININGIPVRKAVYDFLTETWTPTADNTAFNAYTSYADGSGGYPTLADIDLTYDYTDICFGENTFMMIPQDFPAGTVEIVIFFEDGSQKTVTLPETTWKAGKMVVYRIEHQFLSISSPSPQSDINKRTKFSIVKGRPGVFTGTLNYGSVVDAYDNNNSWTNNSAYPWGTRWDLFLYNLGAEEKADLLMPVDGRRDYFISGVEKTYDFKVSNETPRRYLNIRGPWQWLGGEVVIEIDMNVGDVTFKPSGVRYPDEVYLCGSLKDEEGTERIWEAIATDELPTGEICWRSSRKFPVPQQGSNTGRYETEFTVVEDPHVDEGFPGYGSVKIFLSSIHGSDYFKDWMIPEPDTPFEELLNGPKPDYWPDDSNERPETQWPYTFQNGGGDAWYESGAANPYAPVSAPGDGVSVPCSRYFGYSRYKLLPGRYRVTYDMPGETIRFEKL